MQISLRISAPISINFAAFARRNCHTLKSNVYFGLLRIRMWDLPLAGACVFHLLAIISLVLMIMQWIANGNILLFTLPCTLLFVGSWIYPHRRLCKHLEVIDCDWLPIFVKHCLQETMFIKWRFAFAVGAIDNVVLEYLRDVCASNGATNLVALGAGGGGIEPFCCQVLRSLGQNANISLFLTDLVPNIATWTAIRAEFGAWVSFDASPVDATRVQEELEGVRVLTGSLHHFDEQQACGILADAVQCKQPIIIIDGIPSFKSLCILPINSFLLCCSSTAYLLLKAVWTATSVSGVIHNLIHHMPRLLLTVSGILPLIQAHDMLVSVLRFYGETDMRQLIAQTKKADSYVWRLHYPQSGALAVVSGCPRSDQ